MLSCGCKYDIDRHDLSKCFGPWFGRNYANGVHRVGCNSYRVGGPRGGLTQGSLAPWSPRGNPGLEDGNPLGFRKRISRTKISRFEPMNRRGAVASGYGLWSAAAEFGDSTGERRRRFRSREMGSQRQSGAAHPSPPCHRTLQKGCGRARFRHTRQEADRRTAPLTWAERQIGATTALPVSLLDWVTSRPR